MTNLHDNASAEALQTTDPSNLKCKACGVSDKSALGCLNGILANRVEHSRKELILTRKSQLFKPGDIPQGLYCVEKGVVKLTRRGPDGRQVILRLVEGGDIIGLPQILMNETFKESAEVVEDARICFIERASFTEVLKNSPDLNQRLLDTICSLTRETEENFVVLASRSVRERMAATLLDLAKRHGTADALGVTIHLNLTREELASLAGTVLETAVRTLKEFKDDGLLAIDGRRITIVKPEELKRIAS
jgi:CRP/FNR family transcriptional regulator